MKIFWHFFRKFFQTLEENKNDNSIYLVIEKKLNLHSDWFNCQFMRKSYGQRIKTFQDFLKNQLLNVKLKWIENLSNYLIT